MQKLMSGTIFTLAAVVIALSVHGDNDRAVAAAANDPVIAAAGDIACDGTSGASQSAGDKDDYSAMVANRRELQLNFAQRITPQYCR